MADKSEQTTINKLKRDRKLLFRNQITLCPAFFYLKKNENRNEKNNKYNN